MILATVTNMAATPANPTNPLAISPKFNEAIFFKAVAKMRMEVAITVIDNAVLPKPLTAPCILPNISMDTINSPNKPPIATSDSAILSESINDITSKEAARMPIAIAISLSVFAFMFCCQDSNTPPTDSRKSGIPSNDPFKSLVKFLMLSKIAANTPLLKVLSIDLIPPFPIAEEKILPIFEAIFVTMPHIPVNTERTPSKPGIEIFVFNIATNSFSLSIAF